MAGKDIQQQVSKIGKRILVIGATGHTHQWCVVLHLLPDMDHGGFTHIRPRQEDGRDSDAFEKVGEKGDPTEANALLGAPEFTLDDWLQQTVSPKSKGTFRGKGRCQ